MKVVRLCTDIDILDITHYDTIEEFNGHRKAECGQLNVAHITKNQKICF